MNWYNVKLLIAVIALIGLAGCMFGYQDADSETDGYYDDSEVISEIADGVNSARDVADEIGVNLPTP